MLCPPGHGDWGARAHLCHSMGQGMSGASLLLLPRLVPDLSARPPAISGIAIRLFSRHSGTGASSNLSSPLSLWQGENDFYYSRLICV